MASETSEASDSEALKPQTSSTTPTTVMASGNTMDRFMSVANWRKPRTGRKSQTHLSLARDGRDGMERGLPVLSSGDAENDSLQEPKEWEMAENYENVSGTLRSRTLGEQSSKVVSDIRELGNIAKASVTEAAHELRDQGSAMLEAGRERVTHYRDDFERAIAAHPFRSVLIAVGIGALLGLTMRRS